MATADESGCPPAYRFDFDRDGDMDLADFAVFGSCSAGPANPYDQTQSCQEADVDSNSHVDLADFAAIQQCFSGEDAPGDPDCVGTGETPPPPGMVLAPGGSFQMGNAFVEGYSDELPMHTVYLSTYYIDKYEVTNGALGYREDLVGDVWL